MCAAKFVYMLISQSKKKPKSFFMYIELNFGSLLKTYFANLELTIGHLKVGKLKKTLSLCHYIG
jgi:hypothetical protein